MLQQSLFIVHDCPYSEQTGPESGGGAESGTPDSGGGPASGGGAMHGPQMPLALPWAMRHVSPGQQSAFVVHVAQAGWH